VVNDEGLRSHKAVAFIGNVRTINYLKLGAPLQKTVLTKQETPSGFSKNLGEKLWIK
jgi:hypothetical protein